MKKYNFIKTGSVLIALTASIYIGCQPEKFGNGNGLEDTNVNASFTVTPIEGKANYYLFKADEEGVLGLRWDKGDGLGFNQGKAIDTVFYPDAGTYTVGLMAIGKGGASSIKTQDFTVETSDPNSGNLVIGGKMFPEDDDKWTRFTISSGVVWTLDNDKGRLTATGGNWGHQGIYQAIDVEANKKYKVDMGVYGSGATDTWFEVYVGTTQPVQGSDYSDGGKRLAINTWSGCGKTPFSTKLSAISCDGTGGGVVQFPTAGTVYLVVKTGGANLGTDGIAIDNVEFRGVK